MALLPVIANATSLSAITVPFWLSDAAATVIDFPAEIDPTKLMLPPLFRMILSADETAPDVSRPPIVVRLMTPSAAITEPARA